MTTQQPAWLAETAETIESYRRMIDAIVAQLADEELYRRPADGINSVAILLRHLGGNLQSRWTDFLTTDGEKPSRDRDQEFVEWDGDRVSLLAYFEKGWQALVATINSLSDADLKKNVLIRGEAHTVPQAILRAITHVSYHVGQMAMVARMVHKGDWQWLTIAPQASRQHNKATWGTAASRGVAGVDREVT
jgi:uncharacterized damage-inducible protein DinB